jgi:DNA-binding CsgD family transcriptional regulator
MPHDLSRLTDAERRLLGLLVNGHTVKSAAALIGATETAVQERLRVARRKTGVTSSRELARLVLAARDLPQIIRDSFSGVATSPGLGQTTAASTQRGRKG